ncbi:MAG: DUF1800 domain-containing protein [Burkholderiaceae bacterium]
MDSRALPALTRRHLLVWAAVPPALLAACATPTATPPPFRDTDGLYRAVNRLGWGATQAQLEQAAQLGWGAYVDQQLKAEPRAPLPAAAQAQLDALSIERRGMAELVAEADELRRNQDKPPTEDERKATRQAYQAALNLPAREAAHRQLLRQLYSRQQLLEQISWFWFNHFNVHQYKRELRVLLPDYEEAALRPQALGSFRQLLGAVARHPAMLRYLDNDQNSAVKPNENYARELLELHTLGVDGGYSQRDVQELARVLTGFGVRTEPGRPRLRPEQESQYVRQGLFEFNPARHDFGAKTVLGHAVQARGAAELDEVLDLLVAQPATARFISRKLAVYFLSDAPPQPLVDAMAAAFQRSRGDIASTLRVLLLAPEFAAAQPAKFKDPQHYLLSSLRVVYGDAVILNSQPLQGWLRRLGEGLYDRQTPDGYPLTAGAWDSAGQMSTRFELARAIGAGPAGLFKTDALEAVNPPRPRLAEGSFYQRSLQAQLSAGTRAALAQAGSPQQWNALLLSAPEFMYR